MQMGILEATLIDFTNIRIKFHHIDYVDLNKIKILNGNSYIDGSSIILTHDGYFNVSLVKEIDIKFKSFLIYNDDKLSVSYNNLYKCEEFNRRFFTAENLFYILTPNSTSFKLWTPAASSVSLLIYNNGDADVRETPHEYKMSEHKGVWSITINKNLENLFYTFKINVYGTNSEVVDPYALSVGVNGLRGAIIDFTKTSPKSWDKDQGPKYTNYTDSIIYEISIRDMTYDKNSSVTNKGKYLGLTEENTLNSFNQSTSFSHIKELGVTHVQIMPFYDFSHNSINEKNPIDYNWGYDPVNLNCTEGAFCTDPYNPYLRVKELKKMIHHFHKNNIGVIMDVVFNHLFKLEETNFHGIFPGYYFRYYNNGEPSNGTGCGNDTASENLMMRKFIIDSLVHWTKEYHIDGFRFDLMGIHDSQTMKILHKKLKEINPNIIIYGEGWDLNTNLPLDQRASSNNFKELPTIGFFNDYFRDILKGNIFYPADPGYVNGKPYLESHIRNCVVGSVKYKDDFEKFSSPCQSINYISCHDNHTLWDKFQLNSTNSNIDDKTQMVKLALAILLTSQGVPFLHSGVELCRTKNGIENSYNSSDDINAIDWNRKADFKSVFEYTKGLIELRLNHPAFRLSSTDAIKTSLEFINNTPENVVAFFIKHHANKDDWRNILVIYNPNKHSVDIKVPYKSIWNQVVNKYSAGNTPIKVEETDFVHVGSLCANVYYEG
jgi:pullulanase